MNAFDHEYKLAVNGGGEYLFQLCLAHLCSRDKLEDSRGKRRLYLHTVR